MKSEEQLPIKGHGRVTISSGGDGDALKILPPVQVPGETKWSTRLEGGCPACAAKHLAQSIVLAETGLVGYGRDADSHVWLWRAFILDHESRHGYPGHKWLAIGCLANAEVCFGQHMAEIVREKRLYYTNSRSPGLLETIFEPVLKDHLDFTGSSISRARMKTFTFWAHIEEAMAELPAVDDENRNLLEALRDGPIAKIVPEVSRILKNVVETYALGGGQ